MVRRGGATGWIAATAIVALVTLSGSTEGGARSAPASSPTGGIPNPADDRLRMVQELEQLNASLRAIQTTLERGGVRVEVTKMPAAK